MQLIIEKRIALVVAEEWEHFQRVLHQLSKRGYQLGKQRTDHYVVELNKHLRKGGSREQQLMEKLLLNALIEARSCERFKILSENINDHELREFYQELMVSEASHYRNFLELAKEYMPSEVVKKRWKELLEIETEIMRQLEVRGDRMH